MAALLHAEEDVHRLELGPQILDLDVVLALELLQRHFELGLRGLDVLADEGRPLLQVGTNIAHLLVPPRWLTLLNPSPPTGFPPPPRTTTFFGIPAQNATLAAFPRRSTGAARDISSGRAA